MSGQGQFTHPLVVQSAVALRGDRIQRHRCHARSSPACGARVWLHPHVEHSPRANSPHP
jgi:hypothetical protein